MATNGAETIANELMTALLTGVDVTVPTINTADSEFQIPGDNTSDAYDVLLKLTNADLTTGAINGTGSFDKLMVGVAAQLQGEYDAGRITGAEYSKAYITLTQSALATSLQFLLGKDASYWQAVQAQTQAVIARVQLATVKAENARAQIEALTAKSNYALTKLKLATEDAQYGISIYNLQNTLPVQKLLIDKQKDQVVQQTTNLVAEALNIPKQGDVLDKQALQIVQQTANLVSEGLGIDARTALVTQQKTNLVSEELNIPKQGTLLDNQAAQISQQTANLLSENANIVKQGLQIEAQTALSTQQKTNLISEELNISKQGTVLTSQAAQITQQTANLLSENANIPKQGALIDSNKAVQDAQKLSIDKANSISDYNLATVLPSQVAMTNAQKLGQDKQNETANYNLINLLPKQLVLLEEQRISNYKENAIKSFNIDYLLPKQLLLSNAELLIKQEQAEAQRGQTMDTRSDGTTPIAGSIGKQNALYAQQVVSYQKDSQLKAAKVFSDVWITCRSIDEGFPLPTQFATSATQAAMQAIIDANDLG